MKTRYTSILGILTVVTLLVSFLLPARLVSPTSVSADSNVMEWTTITTPNSEVLSPVNTRYNFLEAGSEIIKVVTANNGSTMYAIVSLGYISATATGATWNGVCSPTDNWTRATRLYKSTNGGRSWSTTANDALHTAANKKHSASYTMVYDVAISPDDPNVVIAAVAGYSRTFTAYPPLGTQYVFVTTDGGTLWEDTLWTAPKSDPTDDDIISAMDITPLAGTARYLMVTTRDGGNDHKTNVQTMKVPGYAGWVNQSSTNPIYGDIIDAHFSPTFAGDGTVVVVYSTRSAAAKATTDYNRTGTFLRMGVLDTYANSIVWQVEGMAVELKNPAATVGMSPYANTIINAMIQMPSDFSGQTPSLRRAYVSTSTAYNAVAANGSAGANSGIYRIDDNVVYNLMDTTNTEYQKIHSIAYWGTYASGKLLAGEKKGYACTAAVPVWFTDSPTVCPIPCWYPAKKPPTGAAGQADCTAETRGNGNAYVLWSATMADQGIAYTATGSENWIAIANNATALGEGGVWLFVDGVYDTFVPLDESAFSVTRNNGATWNQFSLIDTRMAKLTDFAISPDCTTAYLASVNNETKCRGFDSVWRTSTKDVVNAPLYTNTSIGGAWERVMTRPTGETCTSSQSNYAILRLAQDKLDGQVVFWAAGGVSGRSYIGKGYFGTDSDDNCAVTDNMSFLSAEPDGTGAFPVGSSTNVVEWSPDYGDYWADIRPRLTVQDMAAPTSSMLYIAGSSSFQKMPYTGTAWASTAPTVTLASEDASGESTGGPHTIKALGASNILIGKTTGGNYSSNAGDSFSGTSGSKHIVFDAGFDTNKFFYYGSDTFAGGGISRGQVGGATGISMMTACGGHMNGYYGLVTTNALNASKQSTLYGAHAPVNKCGSKSWLDPTNHRDSYCYSQLYSGVERTLTPQFNIPKPCLEWDCLDAACPTYQNNSVPVWFTLEPDSLKICGCTTQDTNAMLYALDNDWYGYSTNMRSIFAKPDGFDASQGLDCSTGYSRLSSSQGRLWHYTDCMAKNAPKLTMADGTLIGCDPATGRNQEVNFTWEQLCIANAYELVIAKDKAMTLPVFMIGSTGISNVYGQGRYEDNNALVGFTPYDVTKPSLVYLSGGEGIGGGSYTTTYAYDGLGNIISSSQAMTPSLECGHTYYWKVRVRNETTFDAVRSPWSDPFAFTIKAGFRVTTPYYGPQLLSPDNGCGCACTAPLAFSWSPFKETTEYRFELSTNADMSSPVVTATTKTTAYMWTGTPACNKVYFWRVMATQPAPSEYSATFSFMTQAPPPAATTPPPPVTITQAPASTPTVTAVVNIPKAETPLWVWAVIGIGSILVIVVLVLIFKTRRV